MHEELHWEPIPYETSGKSREMVLHPFLLPSDTICRMAPSERMAGVPDADLRSVSQYQVIRELEQDGNLQVLACRLWIDAANYTGNSKSSQDSVVVFLWNFVMENSGFNNRKIITVIRRRDCCSSCGCAGRCTIDRIKQVINWDFANLRRGKRAQHDSLGGELAPHRRSAWEHHPDLPVKGFQIVTNWQT